jgi:hypothetical protein
VLTTLDIIAARTHTPPALCPAAARGLPTLTDKGYTGAGIGIVIPTKGANLATGQPDPQCPDRRWERRPNAPNACSNAPGKALQRVTLDPSRIGAITAAALVLLHLQRPTR